MKLTITPSDETTDIIFSGELNIYAVGSLKEHLPQLLSIQNTLLLDLSQVNELDGCGLQVLLYIQFMRQKANLQTTIEYISEDIRTALRKAGLSSVLEINGSLNKVKAMSRGASHA